LTLNAEFLEYATSLETSLVLLKPILLLLLESKTGSDKVGILHVCCFLLLALSSRRSFAVRLNQPYEDNLALDIPRFHGTYGDLFILAVTRVLGDYLGRSNSASLLDMLLTALANVSPFLKWLGSESCLKLCALLDRCSRPGWVEKQEHRGAALRAILDTFNNLIQYQFEANHALMYCLLRSAPAVHTIADFPPPAGDPWPIETLVKLVTNLQAELDITFGEGCALDQHAVFEHLKRTTMVGLLPLPHPIVLRSFMNNVHTNLWFCTYIWGVIFTRYDWRTLPLYDWKKIRLITIQSAALEDDAEESRNGD